MYNTAGEGRYVGGGVWDSNGPHVHKASCHGAIGELQCGYDVKQLPFETPRLDSTYVPPPTEKQWQMQINRLVPQLHWYQWLTYTVVILTCIFVSVSLIEMWSVYIHIQQAFQEIADNFKNWGN